MFTLFNSDVCNKKCVMDSDVQVIQQSNSLENKGFSCSMGPKCDTRPLVLFTSTCIMAAVMAAMAVQYFEYNVNCFYDDCDSSTNHTILAPNELVGGCTTSPAKRTGVMCLLGTTTAVCLVFFICLIKRVFETVSR